MLLGSLFISLLTTTTTTTIQPKLHKTASNMKPEEKELVFDIDMTDYDEVRVCCSYAATCLYNCLLTISPQRRQHLFKVLVADDCRHQGGGSCAARSVWYCLLVGLSYTRQRTLASSASCGSTPVAVVCTAGLPTPAPGNSPRSALHPDSLSITPCNRMPAVRLLGT